MGFYIVNGSKRKKNLGFTIVELLIVFSIIALLLSIITPRYFNKIEESKEIVLKQNLSVIRHSIDQFYADNGLYPTDLKQLTKSRYLREIPKDPISETSEWSIIRDKESGGVYDVKSLSQEVASDKRVYSEW